jgi:hypothetical protein
MVTKPLARRVAQTLLVLVLGLSAHVTQAGICRGCPTECENEQDCFGWRACEQCPANWHGSCVAGVEGCGYYECIDDGLCCDDFTRCLNFCYCPECEG